jgi:adenylate kinase family enzyme
VRRVAVIGNSGGGKSTLCRALGVEAAVTAPTRSGKLVHLRSPRELERFAEAS